MATIIIFVSIIATIIFLFLGIVFNLMDAIAEAIEETFAYVGIGLLGSCVLIFLLNRIYKIAHTWGDVASLMSAISWSVVGALGLGVILYALGALWIGVYSVVLFLTGTFRGIFSWAASVCTNVVGYFFEAIQKNIRVS